MKLSHALFLVLLLIVFFLRRVKQSGDCPYSAAHFQGSGMTRNSHNAVNMNRARHLTWGLKSAACPGCVHHMLQVPGQSYAGFPNWNGPTKTRTRQRNPLPSQLAAGFSYVQIYIHNNHLSELIQVNQTRLEPLVYHLRSNSL
jgi:hypothetical protein